MPSRVLLSHTSLALVAALLLELVVQTSALMLLPATTTGPLRLPREIRSRNIDRGTTVRFFMTGAFPAETRGGRRAGGTRLRGGGFAAVSETPGFPTSLWRFSGGTPTRPLREAGAALRATGAGGEGEMSTVHGDNDDEEEGVGDEEDTLTTRYIDGREPPSSQSFSINTPSDDSFRPVAGNMADGGEQRRDARATDAGDSTWPRLFAPPDEQGDDDDGMIRPLIELPLDGVLLQLFPALLIGVLGLLLAVAVQGEAGRFDAMGEAGAPVVVTDLRETRTPQP